MADIDAAVSPSPWTTAQFLEAVVGEEGRDYTLVADIAGVVSGFVVCQCVVGELSVHNVAVAPGAQRQGLASSLLRRAIAEAGKEAQRCLLEVRASNAPALALYRRLGFGEDGRRPNYYPCAGGREDAVLMSLESGAERERA
ncbi:ribosomal protein S18-alanine N-acetyltransferase [Parahaliea maris]|nr:ribosomal protein S18-alanine N-acetyltransferase [Parahaliea maris]